MSKRWLHQKYALREIMFYQIVGYFDRSFFLRTHTCKRVFTQCTIFWYYREIIFTYAINTMLLIFSASIVLNNGITSYTFLRYCFNATFVVVVTVVHYYVCTIWSTLYTNYTRRDIITLHFSSITFTYFYTRPINVFNFQTQNKLTCTFTLNKTSNYLTICYRTVLYDYSVISFGASKNTSSAKLFKCTVRNLQIRLDSNDTSIMICFIS